MVELSAQICLFLRKLGGCAMLLTRIDVLIGGDGAQVNISLYH